MLQGRPWKDKTKGTVFLISLLDCSLQEILLIPTRLLHVYLHYFLIVHCFFFFFFYFIAHLLVLLSWEFSSLIFIIFIDISIWSYEFFPWKMVLKLPRRRWYIFKETLQFQFMFCISPESQVKETFFFFFFFLVFLHFLGQLPAAYGGSQARGRIGAVTANAGSEPPLQPTPQLTETLIVNPLSKTRDRTRNLLVPSRIR